jgi:hypothetical protein
MQTVRRVYLYVVAFISFLTILWAAIGLALMIIDAPPPGSALIIRLAGLLSALIVAIPFYLVHWLIAQRLARDNSDERSAISRSIFHYALMLITAATALGSFGTLLRDLLEIVIGGRGTPTLADMSDNSATSLIIIAFNTAAWFYARRYAVGDQKAIAEQGGRATIHRIYRFLFLSAGLVMTGSGVGNLLLALLEPQSSTTEPWRSLLAVGLTNLIIGAPLWTMLWITVQKAFAAGGEEAESTLRKGYLYLVSLVACLASITSAASIVSHLLQRLMGVPASSRPIMADLANPLTIIIVTTVIWIYHSRTLAADAAGIAEGRRQRGLRRLYNYLLATVGLSATLAGAFGLARILAAALGGAAFSPLRVGLSNGLASLMAGLPLWLIPWNPLQQNSQMTDDLGDEARGSLVRRIYLYLFVFVGVIGSLISAAGLINLILRWILGALPESPISGSVQNALFLAISGGTLTYHLLSIMGDGKRQRTSRRESLASFPVALIGSDDWTGELAAILARMLPGMPLECGESKQAKEAMSSAKAAVIPSSLLFADTNLRKQLDKFDGLRIIVPDEHPGWAWAGAPPQDSVWKEAQDISPLLEMGALGEPLKARRRLGGWGVTGIVLLVLLGLAIFLPIIINVIDSLS